MIKEYDQESIVLLTAEDLTFRKFGKSSWFLHCTLPQRIAEGNALSEKEKELAVSLTGDELLLNHERERTLGLGKLGKKFEITI